MRKAKIYVKGVEAGTLTELQQGKDYLFEYLDRYEGLEITKSTLPKKPILRISYSKTKTSSIVV